MVPTTRTRGCLVEFTLQKGERHKVEEKQRKREKEREWERDKESPTCLVNMHRRNGTGRGRDKGRLIFPAFRFVPSLFYFGANCYRETVVVTLHSSFSLSLSLSLSFSLLCTPFHCVSIQSLWVSIFVGRLLLFFLKKILSFISCNSLSFQFLHSLATVWRP